RMQSAMKSCASWATSRRSSLCCKLRCACCGGRPVMLNRIKARVRVYGRHIEVIFIISALLLGGGVGGYMIGRVEMADVIARIQTTHVADIERIQTGHKETISAIAGRLDEIVSRLDYLAD